jgi:protein-disulfide isomerase
MPARFPLPLPLAVLAAVLSAVALACASAKPAAAPATEPSTAAEALRGIDLEGISEAQRAILEGYAKEAFCYCGCPHTLAQCLREHASCRHAPRMANLAVRLVRAGASRQDLERTIAGYYASFDHRARLDVSRYGPPLADAAGPVTAVEFSDFTCPFCQRVRPALEAFFEARADRAKLFFKPFPIESHPGALEAALAAEWARARGLFWPMHDALFESPRAGTSPDALADLARRVGGDPADLGAALGERRHLAAIRESQVEARAAGIRGTPTLFLNGRMLVLSDFSEEGLEFTLEDEEEWTKHQGWERD